MPELWFPEAKRDPFPSSGQHAGGPAKGVLHSTEGKSYASARSVYAGSRVPPQVTVTYERGRFEAYQHMPAEQAGKALVNKPGGVQTNRDGAFQIEIVGTCDPKWRGVAGWLYLPEAPKPYLEGIARLMRWAERSLGIRRASPLPFRPYPSSYGSNGVRMSGAAWENFSSWCGHQHVPENSHGDPGAIDVAFLIGSQGGGTAVQPQFSPPLSLQIAGECACPSGGAWVVFPDGGVGNFGGAPLRGSPNGKPYWGARKAADIYPVPLPDDPAEPGTARWGYRIQATTGEWYGPDF